MVKKRAPALLIITGFILLFLAGGITAYGATEHYFAGRRAQAVLEEMGGEIPPIFEKAGADSNDSPSRGDVELLGSAAKEEPILEKPVSPPDETAEKPKPRYNTVGTLIISTLKLELPVLAKCNDNLLRVSVCRYAGEAAGKPERLIVAGHNYKSHFGRLNKLALGDEIYFVDRQGIGCSYTVVETAEISEYDHEGLARGDWDITLFTCNAKGDRRLLVRCREKEE